MEEQLKTAGRRAYGNGYSCSQAVFCAFADELGLDEKTAYRIMEGFGALQEVCGAFCAATVIISYYTSNGDLNGKNKRAMSVQ